MKDEALKTFQSLRRAVEMLFLIRTRCNEVDPPLSDPMKWSVRPVRHSSIVPRMLLECGALAPLSLAEPTGVGIQESGGKPPHSKTAGTLQPVRIPQKRRQAAALQPYNTCSCQRSSGRW